MRPLLSVVLIAAGIGAASAGGRQILFREDFSAGINPAWQKVQFKGETKHSVINDGTNLFLQAFADNSASGLGVKLNGLDPAGATVSWKWKIDRIPPGGSDDKIKTFDHTARVFVAFKTFIGPPRTINYVWGNAAAPGKIFHHPNSNRSRFIVLQSGNANAGQWVSEQRDLTEDWKLLFGDESVPRIVGFGFMTDSDGTGTVVTGSYDDFELRGK